jgi:hypothetical protein
MVINKCLASNKKWQFPEFQYKQETKDVNSQTKKGIISKKKINEVYQDMDDVLCIFLLYLKQFDCPERWPG